MESGNSFVVTRTPLRLSLLGGGTDYPAYYAHTDAPGQTLGVALRKHVYVTVKARPDILGEKYRVAYSKVELAQNIGDIEHPAVRACLRNSGISHGLEVGVLSDLPARTGTGSSSAFTVGLLNALSNMGAGRAFSDVVGGYTNNTRHHRKALAELAVTAERDWMGELVGNQDQYTCAVGGVVHLTHFRNGRVGVGVIPFPQSAVLKLERSLMLFYTGIQRTASEVLPEQIRRTQSGEHDFLLRDLAQLAAHGTSALMYGFVAEIGPLLHQAWMIKRKLSTQISSEVVDRQYEAAIAAGATGGKLMGAGGGGFLLLFVPEQARDSVINAMSPMPWTPVEFDFDGTTLLVAK